MDQRDHGDLSGRKRTGRVLITLEDLNQTTRLEKKSRARSIISN